MDTVPRGSDNDEPGDKSSWGNIKMFIGMVEIADTNRDAELFVRGVISKGVADGMPTSLLQELGRVVYKNRLNELRGIEGN